MQRSILGTKPSSGLPVTLVGISPGKMCGRREGGRRRGICATGSAPGDMGHLIPRCQVVHLPQGWNFYQVFGNCAKHLTCAPSQTTAQGGDFCLETIFQSGQRDRPGPGPPLQVASRARTTCRPGNLAHLAQVHRTVTGEAMAFTPDRTVPAQTQNSHVALAN